MQVYNLKRKQTHADKGDSTVDGAMTGAAISAAPSPTRRRLTAELARTAGTTTALLLLLVAAPTPPGVVTTLRSAGSSPDPAEPLVAALALAAWLLAGWLLACIACTSGSHLPGAVGRRLGDVAARTTPRAVRRGLEATLGLTIAVGALAGPAGAAGPSGAREVLIASAIPAAAVAGAEQPPLDLDWGQPAPGPNAEGRTGPDADSAGADPPRPSPVPEPVGPQHTVDAVVRAGDTLWAIAERELRAAGAVPTARAVAQRWPAWWAANRDAVGGDPDLITPGLRLVAPPQRPL